MNYIMTKTNKMVANQIEIFKIAGEYFSHKEVRNGKEKTIYTNEATLSYDDAVKLGFTISPSKSQLLAWIYAERGIELEQVGAESGGGYFR